MRRHLRVPLRSYIGGTARYVSSTGIYVYVAEGHGEPPTNHTPPTSHVEGGCHDEAEGVCHDEAEGGCHDEAEGHAEALC